jgi:hypothetical protein
VLAIFILYLMFIWPKKVSDWRIREKVYEIAFQAVKEMQLKLEEVFGIGGEGLMREEEGSIINDLFTMKKDDLYYTFANLDKQDEIGQKCDCITNTDNDNSPYTELTQRRISAFRLRFEKGSSATEVGFFQKL